MESPRRAWTGVFAKRPVTGQVKTRLVPPLTGEQAAFLQAGMLADSVQRLRAGAASWQPILAFAPSADELWFGDSFPDLRLVAQEGAGLAQRMERFFAEALTQASGVVMTGSDQPQVSVDRLHEAHAALAGGADLVLGPDAGGGYYLIALRAEASDRAPSLFREVEMSTSGMCEATLAVARRLGLSTEVLREESDVDDAADLEHLVTFLISNPYCPNTEHTRAALRELGFLS